MDKLWSFVDDKGNKQWVWLAIDVRCYRQCAIVDTDYWEAYAKVPPSKCHCAVGKESGLTSYIVRASVAQQNDSTTCLDNAHHAR